ncbi:hypothetical protein ACNPNU_26320, partial [Pseudomonas shirazica]|uniref:hypothetical protein n=1 Tax=Pseudomonas shirazica TaxID=1940636 RepID=UPI003AAD8726
KAKTDSFGLCFAKPESWDINWWQPKVLKKQRVAFCLMRAGEPAKGPALSTYLFHECMQLAKLPVARLSILHEGNLNSVLLAPAG